MSNLALSVVSMRKSFENVILLDNVNMRVDYGEICALTGRNGIGKTILLKCILGFEPFDQGDVTISGYRLRAREHIRRLSAYIPSESYSNCDVLTPDEYFHFIINVYNLPLAQSKANIDELAGRLGISDHLNRLIKELSFGTKKKVFLLAALLYDPHLLVCDEIFEGLDQASVSEVIALFKERAKNKRSVLLTTHLHHLVDIVASSVYKIEHNHLTMIQN